MKKLLSAVVVIAMLLALGTTSVFAADGDVLIDYSGKALTDKTGGADQGGIRDADKGVVHLGTSDVADGHALWGYEPDAYDTANATKSFTLVVKAKIVEDGEDTNENVLRVDPKIRPQDGIAEPADSGDYYSGERLDALKADKDGYVYLYTVMDAEDYAESTSIKIENRVWFKNAYGWEIDVYALTLYEGDLSETFEAMGESGDSSDVPTTPSEPTTPGDGEEPPKTADISVMLAVLATGAAAFGGLKLRRK